MKKSSIFTQQLYNRLSKSEPGDVITYSELSELIGFPVQAGKSTAGYGYLMTARNQCLNNDEIVFRPVANVGLEHLVDHKKAEIGYKIIGSLRRKSSKGAKEVSSVQDYSSLTNQQKIMHNTALSVLGVFNIFTNPKKINKLECTIETSRAKIPTSEVIRMFE